MFLILCSLYVLIITSLLALAFSKMPRISTLLGAAGTVIACLIGIIPALWIFITGSALQTRIVWNIPFCSFNLYLDALSGFFLVPVFALSALAALYGVGYVSVWHHKKPVGALWFFYNILIASMITVLTAHNSVLFLIAWEIMSISSFFLVTFDDEKETVRVAGLTYLIASHIGTAFLIALFILLGRGEPSLDFDSFATTVLKNASMIPALFLLAVAGFGTKAGFMPLHVWLPEAHPAAPSHVSAIMSGVMIKTGIYGLLRILTFLGPPKMWWGWTLIGIGMCSGIMGIIFALAQRDLKRLLAYSSIENIGIITTGIGVGVLGLAYRLPVLAVLGFTGSLLHVLNHSLFKGLLFFGAGSILHSAGTGDLDSLGGALKRMPYAGTSFLIGAVAIAGLPPLNGFISEFLIYLGAFHGISHTISVSMPTIGVIVGLSLIGGLAAACFTNVFGSIFSGTARTEKAHLLHEPNRYMLVPMMSIAAVCALLGLCAPAIIPLFENVINILAQVPHHIVNTQLSTVSHLLLGIVSICAGFYLFCALITWSRYKVLRTRQVGHTVTWDCGYVQPSARMQYTFSSFAQPLTDFFGFFLKPVRRLTMPNELFTKHASFKTHSPDIFQHSVYLRLWSIIKTHLSLLRWFQHGRLQVYILYIAITLLILLFWKLG